MNFADAMAALDARTNYEASGGLVSPTLDRMRVLNDLLAQPQTGYPSIHVTGTNGKGTTALVASALLSGLDFAVGTYTSPHLHSPRERIAYELKPIGEQDFADTYFYLEPILEEVDAKAGRVTWFEAITAMAEVYFAERSVDAAVFEVGMGGEHDATNLIDGRVAVITKVALDHRELGDTTVQIAAEKAGIVKRGAVCVTGERDPAVLEVIRKRCASVGATMRRIDAEFEITRRALAIGGQALDVRIGDQKYNDLFIPLWGEALATDATIGLAAVAAFLGDRRIDDEVVYAALSTIRDPGRIEVLGRKPLVVVDGAHNADAAVSLVAAMTESFQWERLHVVIGMLSDHFQPGVLEALVPFADTVIATRPPSPRGMDAAVLAQEIAAAGKTARIVADVESACAVAMEHAAPEDAVLITGSLYTVAAARKRLMEKR